MSKLFKTLLLLILLVAVAAGLYALTRTSKGDGQTKLVTVEKGRTVPMAARVPLHDKQALLDAMDAWPRP